MKRLKLKVLSFGAIEVLSRAQMKNIPGGSQDPPPGCGAPDGCRIGSCVASSGACKGYTGECGSSRGSCVCAVICAG